MLKKISKKILKTFLILILLCTIFSNIFYFISGSSISLAFDVKNTFNGSIHSGANGYVVPIKNVLLDALTVVRIVGMAIAIIILIVIGIKIMTAAPSEKAAIKQYLVNYVIGVFIFLGAYGILVIVKTVVTGAF